MASSSSSFRILILLVLYAIAAIAPARSLGGERKVYIVYMGHHAAGTLGSTSSLSHFDTLRNVVDSSFLDKSLVRSYSRSFNGFAANLTAQEQEALAAHEDVVSVFPSITYKLQTTRSWDFIGMAENVHRSATVESDTIIGVIDSGIWPESRSFSGEGFGPPPSKWKGSCKGGMNFTCNNKLIGARYYAEDSARDTLGHGTHTASTAAGNFVKGASFYGIAEGTARGGVPSARIAAYKACTEDNCETSDILAAFDDAIADGVDIISISIGPQNGMELDEDLGIGIGSLHASQKGVLVVQSAGNQGTEGSVGSVMPWLFTVAASTSDRGIVTKVALGNGKAFTGKAVNSFALEGRTRVPVVYGKNVTLTCEDEYVAWRCDAGCLEPSLVKGKIVLCNDFNGVSRAFNAGASGVVAMVTPFLSELEVPIDFSEVVPLAASRLNGSDFDALQGYIDSTQSPTVDIFKSVSVRHVDAPKIAGFSSKGPNTIFPDILKPDITAPGVEILAAFSPVVSPSSQTAFPTDNRSVNFSIMSGTSMSCPHVAGAAAYVKSFHPDWSPSVIKSALMTTAWKMNASQDPHAEFSYGAGHIDPVKAVDPGLVYETYTEDYIRMFCGTGYNSTKVQRIFGGNATCPSGPHISPKDLNYPTMTSQVRDFQSKNTTFSRNFTRTVTNVGPSVSRYTLRTSTSPYYNITVRPNVLQFNSVVKRSFNVFISGKLLGGQKASAWLEWSDGVRKVRSPIVVY